MKKISILCFALLSFLFSQSQMRYFTGILQGSQQAPPVTSTGSGVVIVKYDSTTMKLELFGDYADLSDTITGSHIHFGKPGVAGPIVVDLVNSGGKTGTLTLSATLTMQQQDSLLAGSMYANVHTKTNPNGEIRAQLTPTTGQTTFLSGKLQGVQETPPDTSKATGSVYSLVDMRADSATIYVTGSYTGLTAASSAAHVHLQSPGTAGDVLFPIYHSAANSGTVHADSVVTAANAFIIATGGSYVNIHTSTYPGGEIRAQLINNTTVRYLAGDLSGSKQVPPVATAARGTVIVTYNTETNLLELAGDYQNLSDTVTEAHIHRGGLGVAGPVIIPLTTSRDSTGIITGFAQFPDSLEAELLAGNMYVNVHSAKYPNGEIRTQLMPTTSGETHAFAVNLTGAQAGSGSNATSNAAVIVDKITGMTYVTGAFSGINSNVTGAHIHGGQVGVQGPVILPLTLVQKFAKPHSGTFSGSGMLGASAVDSMINGLTYIDIHSELYKNTPALRAQLGDLVLPLKLVYFNGSKQKNNVDLIWETSEELNVSRYEVEQYNTTTKQWITKGTVPAKGGSSAAQYKFTDVPNQYASQYVLYRLKMIDKNGQVTYSYQVKLNFEKLKAELFIQTNPVVNGELKYTITGLSTGKKAEVSIIDYNGRLLLKNTVSSLINNTLRIHQLSAGMYKIIVRIDDTVLQKSFIK